MLQLFRRSCTVLVAFYELKRVRQFSRPQSRRRLLRDLCISSCVGWLGSPSSSIRVRLLSTRRRRSSSRMLPRSPGPRSVPTKVRKGQDRAARPLRARAALASARPGCPLDLRRSCWKSLGSWSKDVSLNELTASSKKCADARLYTPFLRRPLRRQWRLCIPGRHSAPAAHSAIRKTSSS